MKKIVVLILAGLLGMGGACAQEGKNMDYDFSLEIGNAKYYAKFLFLSDKQLHSRYLLHNLPF